MRPSSWSSGKSEPADSVLAVLLEMNQHLECSLGKRNQAVLIYSRQDFFFRPGLSFVRAISPRNGNGSHLGTFGDEAGESPSFVQ